MDYNEEKSYHFISLIRRNAPLSEIQECYYHEPNLDALSEMIHHCWNDEVISWMFRVLAEGGEEMQVLIRRAFCNKTLPALKGLFSYAVENNLEFMTNENIDMCSDLEVLQWWKDNIAPPDYKTHFLNHGMNMYNPKLVKWWSKSGSEIVVDEDFGKNTFLIPCNITCLKTLHHVGINTPVSVIIATLIHVAEVKGNDKMNWFYSTYEDVIKELMCKPLAGYMNRFIADYCVANYELLEFLHEHDVSFEYTEVLVDNIKTMKQAEFWETSGLPIKHTPEGLMNCIYKNLDLGKWWFRNGLEYNKSYNVDALINVHNTDAIQLLMDHGIHVYHDNLPLDSIPDSQIVSQERLLKRTLLWLHDHDLTLECTHIFVDKCIKSRCKILLESFLSENPPVRIKGPLYTQASPNRFMGIEPEDLYYLYKGTTREDRPYLAWLAERGVEVA